MPAEVESSSRPTGAYAFIAWIGVLVAGVTGSVLLWFPSATAGVGVFQALGQYTYLSVEGLAIYAGVSLALLPIPIGLLSWIGPTIGRAKAVLAAGGLVVTWQAFWAAVALVGPYDELIAWPSYVEPSHLDPWNPGLVFAVGLALTGAITAAATLFVAPRWSG